jgi:Exopolysaccharide biosynthesis protein YbjH
MIKKTRLFFIAVLLLFFNRAVNAQIGIGGFDAVMTVPTARLLPDGDAVLGVGYIPSPYALFEVPGHDNLAYFATLGFLPFLEISIRATLSMNTEHPSIGDRMLSLRAQLLNETDRRPAVAIGLHDIAGLIDRTEGTNNYFTALYLVATKTRRLSALVNLETTMGYGVDWITAPSHEFDGLFGGVSAGFHKIFFIKGEYDAYRFNFGLGVKGGEFISANIVLMNGNKLAYGANIRTRL